MTGKQVKDTLTQATNNGVLYYVTFQDGYAVFAEQVLYTDNTRYNPADANTGAVAYTSIAPYAYATCGNSILTLGAMSFNTSAATEVVGKLEATMVDKQIYVIYNTDTRFVSKIYVSDYDKAVDPTAVTTVNSLVVNASQPVTGMQLSPISIGKANVTKGTTTTDEDAAKYVTVEAYWFDATSNAKVEAGSIALSGHTYTVVVTNAKAGTDCKLAANFGIAGWQASTTGTWTWAFAATK